MPPFSLATLEDDALRMICDWLSNPLAPSLAVALSSCSRGLRRVLEAQLRRLKERRQKAEEMCATISEVHWDTWSCAKLYETATLHWNTLGQALYRNVNYYYSPGVRRASLPPCPCTETMGMLLATNAMPQLREIDLSDNTYYNPQGGSSRYDSEGELRCTGSRHGDKVVRWLFGELGQRALPMLKKLQLNTSDIGNAGAATLAAAFSRGAMPTLEELHLRGRCRHWREVGTNWIGDEGMVALAASLRQHTTLRVLHLRDNAIGDEGVAALVAPGEGVLPKLEDLYLNENRITDVGCESLVAGLLRGALPSLYMLKVQPNELASEASLAAVMAARPSLDEYYNDPDEDDDTDWATSDDDDDDDDDDDE